jgi:hypothetical protein
MPKRVIVDENGIVVSVESFAGLKTIPASSKTIKRKKRKKRSAPTSRVVKRSVQPTRSRSNKQSWTTCPKCRASLLQKNFQKHYRKVHPANLVPSSSANEVVTGRAKPKNRKMTRTLTPSSGGKRDRTGKSLGLTGQALYQSFEDSSFGGKGLGHMRREQGRFGSLPLYDDYGEESWAD